MQEQNSAMTVGGGDSTTTTTTQGTTTTTTTRQQDQQQGSTTTTAGTTTTTTTAAGQQSEQQPDGVRSFGTDQVDRGDDNLDMTSIVRGKKINPRTGTQTSEDDPDGVYAANVYNPIQLEHAGHTLTQTTPGAAEKHTEVLQSLSNDGTKGAIEPKPTTPAGVQNDAKDPGPTNQEELTQDKKIQQGETGPESRQDLQHELGGGSGSNTRNEDA